MMDIDENLFSFIKFHRSNSFQKSWILDLSLRIRMKLKDEDIGEYGSNLRMRFENET